MTKTTQEVRFFPPHSSLSFMRRTPSRNSGQKTGGRNRSHGYGLLTAWLFPACSPCRAIYPEMATPTVGRAFPYQSLIEKMPHGLVYRPVWWRQFLMWGSLFPDGSSLCQLDKTKTKKRKFKTHQNSLSLHPIPLLSPVSLSSLCHISPPQILMHWSPISLLSMSHLSSPDGHAWPLCSTTGSLPWWFSSGWSRNNSIKWLGLKSLEILLNRNLSFQLFLSGILSQQQEAV